MIRTLLPAIAILASSCGVNERPASRNDQRWAISAADVCPPLQRVVDQGMKDGSLSNDEVDAVAAAAKIIVANPVKGQECYVKSTSRPSSSRSNIDASDLNRITSATVL